MGDTVRADMPEISLQSAVLFALNNNPDAMIIMERKKQADIAIKEAESALYPQVNLSLRSGAEYNNPTSTPNSGGGDSVISSEARLSLNQLVYDGSATRKEIERRKLLSQSAELASDGLIKNILTDTVRTYTTVWRFQNAVTESERFVAVITKIADKVTLMVESGAESKIKKEFVDSRLANAQSQLNNARANLSSALNQLESLTGRLPDFTAKKPEHLDPTLRRLDSYFRDAYALNSALGVNRSDGDALLLEKASQEGRDKPTISVQSEVRRNDNQGGSVDPESFGAIFVNVNYTLFDGDLRSSTKERIASQIRENKFRQIKLQREVKRDLRFSYNQLLALKDDYMNAQQEIISGESLQSLYQKQFELGEGDIINLIEGEERLYAAKTRALRLETDMIISAYTILKDAGLLEKEEFCATC